MTRLTVRNVSEEMVDTLELWAAAPNGRSAEAEHRGLLRAALLGADKDFAAWAQALRQRLHSVIDSTETIRAVRDGAP